MPSEDDNIPVYGVLYYTFVRALEQIFSHSMMSGLNESGEENFE